MNRTQAIAYLPQFQNRVKVTQALGSGTNAQLVREILADYPKAVQQTRTIAPRFKGATFTDTCRNVWQFLKTEIKYKEDPGLFQHMRLPSALVNTGQGDCKSFSLFTAGILANLGYKVSFRFAGYGTKYPGHVYIVAGNGGQQCIVDAVWKAFNSEKTPYTYLKDYPMEIAHISGIGCANCAPGCDCSIGKVQLLKAVKNAGGAVKTAAKTAADKVKTAASNTGKTLAKGYLKATGMAPRTAFLQLVKLNVRSFATSLDANRALALDKWAKLGGDKGELNASINAGKNRKPILGLDGIGVVGETLAAVLAAAAPIIAAMAAIITAGKNNKANAPTDTKVPTDPPTTPPGTKEAFDFATGIINQATGILQKSSAAAPPAVSPYGSGADTGNNAGNVPAADLPAPEKSSTGIGTGTLVIGALVLFALMK